MNVICSLKVGGTGDGTIPRIIAVDNAFNPAKVCVKVIN